MAEITVTKIVERPQGWRVWFSERVYRGKYIAPHNNWHIDRSNAPDRLAAFKWGMEIIRLNQLREQEDGA